MNMNVLDVTQMTLHEHQRLIQDLTDALYKRKMLSFMSIISNRSEELSIRLSTLEQMLHLMIYHQDFFEKYPPFVQRTPEKMRQISEELNSLKIKVSDRLMKLLNDVENIYAKKNNS